MPDILAADVTYSPVAGGRRQEATAGGNRFVQLVDVSFGNNSKTYPTGGVPLTLAGLQMPQAVEDIVVIDQGTAAKGYKIEPVVAGVPTAPKLRIMVEDTVATNTPLKEHTNATFVPNPALIRLQVRGY